MKQLSVILNQPLRSAHLVSAAVPVSASQPSPSPAASNQWIARLFQELNERVDELERRRQQAIVEMRQLAVELAVAVVGKLTYEKLEADTFPIDKVIEQIVEQLDTNEPIVVSLNPHDHQQFTAAQQDGPPTQQPSNITLVAKADLPRGCYHVDSAGQTRLYDIELNLSEIKQALYEGLEDAEVERRATGAANSNLRRFPDRRSAG